MELKNNEFILVRFKKYNAFSRKYAHSICLSKNIDHDFVGIDATYHGKNAHDKERMFFAAVLLVENRKITDLEKEVAKVSLYHSNISGGDQFYIMFFNKIYCAITPKKVEDFDFLLTHSEEFSSVRRKK